jgi:hypothetical protein
MKGWLQREIADYLSNRPNVEYTLAQPQISYDLKIIRQRWVESSLVNMDEIKAEELAKIDRLEREYWDAWERSLGVHKVHKHRDGGRYDGEEITVEEDSLGDPKYLQGIQWCIDRRVKIFGLDAPRRTETHVEAHGSVIHASLDLNKVDDDELAQLERLLSKALPGSGPGGEGPEASAGLHDDDVLEVQGRALPQEGGRDAG